MKKMYMIGIFVLVMAFAACAYPEHTESGGAPAALPEIVEPDEPSEPLCVYERLAAFGFTGEWLDSLGDTCLETFVAQMENQGRFFEFIDRIMEGRPAVPNGTALPLHYFGGLHFDDLGMLVVLILPAAFDCPYASAAVEEMQNVGIIIEEAAFTERDIWDTVDAMNQVGDVFFNAGGTSWGIGATNRVQVWLDPYTPEQKAIFTELLLEHDIAPAKIEFIPAVTPEMLEWRSSAVAAAIAGPHPEQIVVSDEIDANPHRIIFSLENNEGVNFYYGTPWDLAHYVNGEWLPVPHAPGRGNGMWNMPLFTLFAGETKEYTVDFEWMFIELAPGRYKFIRSGWLGESHPGHDDRYVIIEFVIE